MHVLLLHQAQIPSNQITTAGNSNNPWDPFHRRTHCGRFFLRLVLGGKHLQDRPLSSTTSFGAFWLWAIQTISETAGAIGETVLSDP